MERLFETLDRVNRIVTPKGNFARRRKKLPILYIEQSHKVRMLSLGVAASNL